MKNCKTKECIEDQVLDLYDEFSKCKKSKCKNLQKKALAKHTVLGKKITDFSDINTFMTAIGHSKEVYRNSDEYANFKQCVHTNCNKIFFDLITILEASDEKIKSQILQLNIVLKKGKQIYLSLEEIKKLEKFDLGYGA